MNNRRKVAEKMLKAFFGDGPAEDLSPAIREAVVRLNEAARPRPSRVADMLLAGRYHYLEPDSDPVLVDVTYWDGEPVARVLDPQEEDGGVEFDPRCVIGTFQPVNASRPAEGQPR